MPVIQFAPPRSRCGRRIRLVQRPDEDGWDDEGERGERRASQLPVLEQLDDVPGEPPTLVESHPKRANHESALRGRGVARCSGERRPAVGVWNRPRVDEAAALPGIEEGLAFGEQAFVDFEVSRDIGRYTFEEFLDCLPFRAHEREERRNRLCLSQRRYSGVLVA